MSDLIRRAKQAQSALNNGSLAKHVRIEQAVQCFSGLMLSDLDEEIRDQLTSTLAGWMAVTAPYDFKEGESLERMQDSDLDRCLGIIHIAARDAIEAECQRLIAELDQTENVLPVAAITSIREHRELMIPRLIECIEAATNDLKMDEQMRIGSAPFFALHLLSEFDCQEALPVILEALQLPDEAPFTLFGDTVTETMPEILAQLARPSLDSLMPLIKNSDAHLFAQLAGINAFGCALKGGIVGRQEVLERLQDLLRQASLEDDWNLVTGIVCCLSDIGPNELMPDIRRAFDRQLVDTSMISLKSVEASAERNTLEDITLIGVEGRLGVSDCLKELSRWAAFRPPKPPQAKARGHVVSRPQERGQPKLAGSSSTQQVIGKKPGRNDPCPCGSRKKYKKCCGSA